MTERRSTMRPRAWIVATALAHLTVAVNPASAEEPSLGKRVEDLEQRHDELNRELQQLREGLERPAAGEESVEELRRRQFILTDEVRSLREALTVPETTALKSAYGLGPAASKVYGRTRGLSIGGYGEANFQLVTADRGSASDSFDFLRFVLYVGYKFNDWIVFNSETEFEHATTEGNESLDQEGGSVSVEFAQLDFLFHPRFNLRAGLVLVPMGFLNEIHEPPFFFGNLRPQVEQQVLPSTWRANGVGIFGELVPGLEYRTYGVTSLDASGFTSGNLRDARQNGSRERANDWSWVGRLDYTLLPGTFVGGSAYLGDQGQDRSFGGVKPGVFTQIYEGHVQARAAGVEFRALGALVQVDDAAALSAALDQTIAKVMLGYYAEAGYDLMPLLLPDTTHYLAPWFRYSRIDTQNSVPEGFPANEAKDRDIYEVGLMYRPIPEVAVKLDYRIQDAKRGNLPDELRLGAGFVF